VTSIEREAFSGCSGLKSVNITDLESWCKISFEEGSANPLFYAEHMYLNGKEVVNLVIPNGITEIGGLAFYGCKGLTSITIPNSVTSIGNSAFHGCSALTSVTIPNSVTSIGNSAFCGCKGLTSITIPNSVTSIGSSAFNSCYRLTSITIPNSVTSIESSTFSGCSGLTSVTIPNSVTSIGGYAFSGCSDLTSITIPNSVMEIGDYTFENCDDLTSITIPNSVTSIGNSAFYGCYGLTSITIPNSVTNIGRSAFYGCSGLTFVNMGNSVTGIGKETFEYCSGLTSITIPNSVTSIGNSAFYGCSALTSISIGNSVTSIGKRAFSDCLALTSITCEATTPPNCDKDCFDNIEKSIPVYVPVNTVAKYKAVYGWNRFTNIIDNQSIADAVIAKINAIGNVEYTDVCKGKIDDASMAYDALTDAQKALVTNLDILTTAKQTYDILKAAAEKLAADKAAADPVIAKITAIGNVEYTDACKSKIDDASTAYDALTDDQKALVTNLDVLTTARQTYETLKAAAEKLAADKSKANDVIAKINAIGNVEYTDACKGKIDDASTAYEALTSDQKALVTNLDVLTTAKQTYDALKAVAEKLAADKAEADAVVAKIAAIGKVKYTDACKKKIDNASKAYDALTDDQKALVTNLDVLTTARQTYDDLKAAAEKLAADKAAADAVIAKITAIGNVEYTDACKGKIDDASNAYDALTDDQKSLVTNLEVLTTARQTYNTLKAADDELMAYKAAFENYKSELRAIIEALGKEDDSDAVRDIINKAISDIDALEYDVTISLDDNKAKVLSFVNSVDEAVENQRAEDQKASGIEELELAEKVNIYDLSGKKITRSMLKSGLYIRNGKKVLIK